MRKVIAWLAVGFAVGVGLWQLSQAEPYLPHAATGLLLVCAALAVGIRIGYEAARRFVADSIRMHKLLAEQNKELGELNRQLLERKASESPEPSVPEGSPDETGEGSY